MRSSILPYVKIKFNNGISRRALIDTGACNIVISNKFLQEITETDKNAVNLKQPYCILVKMAGGQQFKIDQVGNKIKIAHTEFVEDFHVLFSTNSVTLGNRFFIKQDISTIPKQVIIQFVDLTIQLNEIKPVNEKRRAVRHKKTPIYKNKKQTIQPKEQIFLECYLSDKSLISLRTKSGVMTPNEILEKESDNALTSSPSTVGKNNK